jgi:hypothetical protein
MDRYEALRAQALSPCQRTAVGLGLDLLQRQGVLSWAQTHAQANRRESARLTHANDDLAHHGDHLDEALKDLLTDLALRTLQQEEPSWSTTR